VNICEDIYFLYGITEIFRKIQTLKLCFKIMIANVSIDTKFPIGFLRNYSYGTLTVTGTILYFIKHACAT